MNLYFNRASVFTVYLRPAGIDPNTNKQYTWQPINEQFVVRGNRPVDQYNYLRFIHPEIREYEYRFIPKNGADLTQFVPDSAEFWLLDSSGAAFAGQGIQLSQAYSTPYGTFVVQTAGRLVSKGEIEFAPEMATGVKSNNDVQPIIKVPSDVIIAKYIPDIEGVIQRQHPLSKRVMDGLLSPRPRNTVKRLSSGSYGARHLSLARPAIGRSDLMVCGLRRQVARSAGWS